MSQRRVRLGRYCEKKAIRFLKKKGYKILERNYRSTFGEIDVIAKESNSIVFVEIKSRASPLFGPPYLRVTKRKKDHITKTALAYLKKHGLVDSECRIDVVSISLDKEKDPIELIKDAFSVERWRF